MEKIDGRLLAQKIQKKLIIIAKGLKKPPNLVIIRASDDLSSEIYVMAKIKSSTNVGITTSQIYIEKPNYEKILNTIEKCNNDQSIDAILLQLPLKDRSLENTLTNKIQATKDADGLTCHNQGLLLQGEKQAIIPCTALGVLTMLKDVYKTQDFSKKNAVIFGRSLVVGKPLANLLTNHNATVTLIHSNTSPTLANKLIPNCDIIISATGFENVIDCRLVKNNACLIDVGIIRCKKHGKKSIRGDITLTNTKDAENFWLSPVPFGVGPMTITMLLLNTILLAAKHTNNTGVIEELSKITENHYDQAQFRN